MTLKREILIEIEITKNYPKILIVKRSNNHFVFHLNEK